MPRKKLLPGTPTVSLTIRLPKPLRSALRERARGMPKGSRSSGHVVRKALEAFLAPPESCTGRQVPYAVLERLMRQ